MKINLHMDIALPPTKGHLLIAEPSIIGDISFNRSVILLADHTNEGTIGFILNKPLDYTLADFIPETASEIKVYNGGPVEQDNLYFIHTVPDLIENSTEIAHGIYWGGNFEAVLREIGNQNITDSNIQFFLGYSGWDAFQLDEELESNTWVVKENNHKAGIIKNGRQAMWRNHMIELGGEYPIWSNAPENPSYN